MSTTAMQSRFIPAPMTPVGQAFPWFTETIPDGTVYLDGSTFSATDYPELAVKYPTLTLPDLRGVTVRGMDRGRGLNPDAVGMAVGSYQADSSQGHWHDILNGGNGVNGLASALGSGADDSHYAFTDVASASNAVFKAGNILSDGVNGTPRTGIETRSKSILCYWICYARTMFYDLSIEGANAYMLGGHPASYYVSKQDLANLPATQQAWQTPTLLNGWANYGGGGNPIGYYKDSLGIVHIRGLMIGTIGSTIFTLPIGYRPLFANLIVVYSNGLGRCDIQPDGSVQAQSGTNAYFSLDNISFRAEQ